MERFEKKMKYLKKINHVMEPSDPKPVLNLNTTRDKKDTHLLIFWLCIFNVVFIF